MAVTGAAGFIGSAVCRRLGANGHTVLAVDVVPDPGEHLDGVSTEYRVADLRDARAARRALRDAATIVHAAALVSTWGRRRDFRASNVEATRNVLAAGAAGVRTIHMSTVAIWGYDSDEPIVDEEAPPRPCTAPYAQTKAEAEILARAAGATIIRPGDVYGPGAIAWSLRAVTKLQAGTFYLPGAGEGLMAPIYVDDLVDCVARAVERPLTAPACFTVWDGQAVTAVRFFGYLAAMAGDSDLPLIPFAAARRRALRSELIGRVSGRRPPMTRHALLFMSRRSTFPNAKAQAVLGWRPQVALPEGMRRTQVWLEAVGVL